MTDSSKSYEERYDIVLPCPQNQFAEFISSLLGKPQTIERRVTGIFEVTKSDLINIFHLVNQRVSQQNEGSLVQFTVRVLYSDGSSVLLTSLDDFEAYNEISPRLSTAVQLSWIYLLTFSGGKYSEKQEIELAYQSSQFPGRSITMSDTAFVLPAELKYGRFAVAIKHTARSWGVDIEGLLVNHLETLRKRANLFEAWVTKHSEKIGISTALLIYAGTILGIYLVMSQFSGQLLASSRGRMADISSVHEKIDFLLATYLTGAWPQFVLAVVVFALIMLIVGIIFGALVTRYAYNPRRSFLLLTKQAQEDYAEENRKTKYVTARFIGALLLAVVVGVVSNLIFWQTVP